MRVLVATDLSEASLLVIEGLCATPPQPFDRAVLLHVIDLPLYPAGGSIPQIREWASEKLADAAARLRRRGFETSSRVEEGDAVRTIERVAAEEGCDLVMVTSLGRNAAAQRIFGSIAERLPATGRLPVLVDRVAMREKAWCRLGSGSPFARPLVAVDLHEPVRPVCAFVGALPGIREALLVHVAQDEARAAEARRVLEEALASAPGVRWEARVVTGTVVEGVLGEAEAFGATVLAVTSHRHGADRVLKRGLSRELAARAELPVLFLPPSARPAGSS